MNLIDGDALREEFRRDVMGGLNWDRILREAKTVDAVPVRHGRWETVEDWDGDEHYKCSVCGAEFVLIEGDPDDNDYLYCPHCGALMDGKEGDHHD